jgi:hypothetical protein
MPFIDGFYWYFCPFVELYPQYFVNKLRPKLIRFLIYPNKNIDKVQKMAD